MARQGSEYEVYRDTEGRWRWRLWSSSDVIADSGQGYASEHDAERAIRSVRWAAMFGRVRRG
jgi:uncharacterized protein YegP (UPF0339 family)